MSCLNFFTETDFNSGIITLLYQGMSVHVQVSKRQLERRYPTGMVGVSKGNSLILREDPLAHTHRLSRVARHRNVGIDLIFQRTDRNFYKLVHGERTHVPS